MSQKEAAPPLAAAQHEMSWIQKTAGVCGGDACIRNTRITVWGLVQRRQHGLADTEVLRRLPGVTLADLEAAWDYYERNRDEIEQAIRENDEA
jgi:uncharacterized protein (DUF433 family)